MRVTDCSCKEPGWCERHQCEKPRLLFELCQRRPSVFQQWEEYGCGRKPDNAPRRPPCTHLGEVVRTAACPGCKGNVRVKVFACAVHQQCTQGKVIGATRSCLDCADYQVQQ